MTVQNISTKPQGIAELKPELSFASCRQENSSEPENNGAMLILYGYLIDGTASMFRVPTGF